MARNAETGEVTLDLGKVADRHAEGQTGDFVRGFRSSSAGLAISGELPPPTPSDQDLIDSLQQGAGQFVGDFPLGVLGAAIGAAAGSEVPLVGNVVGGGVGAFALPELVSETLRQAYAKGEIQSVGDFMHRFSEVAKETGKAGLLGGLTAGSGVATKAALPAAKNIVTKALPTIAEVATAGTLGPVLEGESPTAGDYIAQAAPIVGMKLAGKAASSLKGAHKESGKNVADVAKEIQDLLDDATIKGEKLSFGEAAQRVAEANKKSGGEFAVNDAKAGTEFAVEPTAPNLDAVASKKYTSSRPPAVDPKFARESIRALSNEAQAAQSHRSPTPLDEQLSENSPGKRVINDINDKLPGTERPIEQEVPRRADKLWRWTRLFMSPERAALSRSKRREGIVVDMINPAGQDFSSKIIGGELYFHQRMADAATTFYDTSKGLSKADRLLVRPVMELIYKDGDYAKRAQQVHPEVFKAAESLVKWFDSAKQDIKQYYKVRLQRNLTPLQRRALDELIVSKDKFERVTILNRYAFDDITKRRLSALYGKYAGIDNWGLPDYITNIELGAYRIRDKQGVTRAFAQTRKEARKKYEALIGEDPIAFDNFTFDKAFSTEFHKSANPLVRRKRDQNLKGEADIFDAMNAYASSVYKRLIFEPIEFELRDAYRKRPGDFPQELRGLLNQQVMDARGNYSLGERMFDQIAISLGKKPGAYGKTLTTAKGVTARLALGYRAPAMLSNMIGGYGKIWVKHGLRDLGRARQFMRTETGKKFLLEEEKLGSLGVNVFIAESGKVSTKLKKYDPLWLFSLPEPHIRKLNLSAAYIDGLMKGMTEPAAREYARRMLRMTNFTYNTAALPEIMRSTEARLITQFKSYLVKELEFMHTLTPKEWARYTTYNMLTGGPRVAMQMIKSIPVLGALGLLDELDLGLEDTLGEWYRGLPGKTANVDLSSSIALQLPNDPGDVMGLFLSHAVKLYTNVVYPTLRGEVGTKDNLIDWTVDLSPLSRHWEELWDVLNNDGWILNRRGERTHKITSDWDKSMLAVGFSPADISRSRTTERVVEREVETSRNNKRMVMRRVIRRLNATDDIDRDIRGVLLKVKGAIPESIWGELYGLWAVEGKIPADLREDIVNYGLSPEAIRMAVATSKLDAKQRLLRRMSLRDRVRALDVLD